MIVSFTYKNWKGTTKTRHVKNPTLSIKENGTSYHPDGKLFLSGYCLDSKDMRDFLVRDIDEGSVNIENI